MYWSGMSWGAVAAMAAGFGLLVGLVSVVASRSGRASRGAADQAVEETRRRLGLPTDDRADGGR